MSLDSQGVHSSAHYQELCACAYIIRNFVHNLHPSKEREHSGSMIPDSCNEFGIQVGPCFMPKLQLPSVWRGEQR